jgi:hypothetical protein
MTVFGPTISAYDVERHVRDTLQYWFESYLQNREIEVGVDRGSIARPKSWRTIRTFDEKNPEDATPFVAIVSDGLARPPAQEGDGSFRATWVIGIGVVIEAKSEADAQLLVKHIYLPVILKILMQKQSLRDWTDSTAEAWSDGIEWLDEAYDEVVSDMERTLYNGQLTFEVGVSGVLNRSGGPTSPADPVTQPGSEWPLVQTVSVDVKV